MDHAGAALAGVAADMGAGETKLLAQQFDKQGASFDFYQMLLAVDRQGYLGHRTPFRCSASTRRGARGSAGNGLRPWTTPLAGVWPFLRCKVKRGCTVRWAYIQYCQTRAFHSSTRSPIERCSHLD